LNGESRSATGGAASSALTLPSAFMSPSATVEAQVLIEIAWRCQESPSGGVPIASHRRRM
jgi:hypothetical protein